MSHLDTGRETRPAAPPLTLSTPAVGSVAGRPRLGINQEMLRAVIGQRRARLASLETGMVAACERAAAAKAARRVRVDDRATWDRAMWGRYLAAAAAGATLHAGDAAPLRRDRPPRAAARPHAAGGARRMSTTSNAAERLPPLCYVRHVTMRQTVAIRRGVDGYTADDTHCSPECLNALLQRVPTEDEIAAMRHGSIMGWNEPGIDRLSGAAARKSRSGKPDIIVST